MIQDFLTQAIEFVLIAHFAIALFSTIARKTRPVQVELNSNAMTAVEPEPKSALEPHPETTLDSLPLEPIAFTDVVVPVERRSKAKESTIDYSELGLRQLRQLYSSRQLKVKGLKLSHATKQQLIEALQAS